MISWAVRLLSHRLQPLNHRPLIWAWQIRLETFSEAGLSHSLLQLPSQWLIHSVISLEVAWLNLKYKLNLNLPTMAA